MARAKSTGSGAEVVVIGGGPAGMMAAIVAARRGRRVLLLEKNRRLGEKLRITGGGRCNVTNAEPDTRKFLERYGDAARPLAPAFARFSPEDTFAFFASLGLPLEVEDRGRAFPKTRRAPDVERVLERAMAAAGVLVRSGVPVTGLRVVGGRVAAAQTSGGEVAGDSFVLATGGLSHPETGSTGDGFRWLSALGVPVNDPTPSIVPLAVEEVWVGKLAGLALDDAKVTFYRGDRKAFAVEGRILFAHFGLTGPTILNAAARVGDLLSDGPVRAAIDLFPREDEGAVERRFLSALDAAKNQNVVNALAPALPAGAARRLFAPLSAGRSALAPETKAHSVTREDRKALARAAKALPITVTGLLGFDRAVVADGGVPLSEIDTRTFACKKFPNLYLLGDVLDVRRPSGGFSLQLCWTSGAVAGENV
jgi:predicted Rossmann fold flavoprotein